MDTLRERIIGVLKAAYNDSNTIIEIEEGYGGNISGRVVSTAFIAKDDKERQNEIWTILRKEFADNERLKIALILAFTPYIYETIGS